MQLNTQGVICCYMLLHVVACCCHLLQAAAALLFGQLMRCGAAVEVVPEDILTATLSEFTDLAQVSRHGNSWDTL